jgi:hypothetical protein
MLGTQGQQGLTKSHLYEHEKNFRSMQNNSGDITYDYCITAKIN